MSEDNFIDQLTELISITDSTQKGVGDMLGVTGGYISRVLAGAKTPSPQFKKALALRLSQAKLKSSPVAIPMRTQQSKRRVPVVSWALAGNMQGRGAFEDLANQIDESIETSSRDPNAFAIEISGDSMEPTASHRDCVVFEPNMEAPNGWPVLVKLIDGRVFFKRLYRTGGKITLESDNETHPNLEFEQHEIAFVYPAKDIVKTASSRPRQKWSRPLSHI
jgi:SOS-response transcriptional repressor LexA